MSKQIGYISVCNLNFINAIEPLALTFHPNSFSRCETCKMHFLTFHFLNRHQKETHNAKEFKCKEPKCVDSFETQQLLDAHSAKKHSRVECPHCKKKVTDSFLVRHIRDRHGTNDVVCELCGKVSLNKALHREHHKISHVERLQCDICGQWYIFAIIKLSPLRTDHHHSLPFNFHSQVQK